METKWKGIYSQKYAAEIEKLRAKQPKGGRPPKLSKPTQSIASVSKDERTTDAIRAKAAGTNRTYVRDMEKIAAEHPNDVLETCGREQKNAKPKRGRLKAKARRLPVREMFP
mgnify:CR=1 FL=1